MYFDYTYLIFIVPAMLLALWAQTKVQSTFKKYSTVISARRMTGAEAARRILDANGLYNVKINRVAGNLTDHFDPRNNTVNLSEAVYDNPSVAAIGVAAHESGHAVQHAVGYSPMKLRAAIIPVTNIGSKLAIPLVLIGILFSIYQLAYIGCIFYATLALFQLVTLPVEFNASNRALEALENTGILGSEEIRGSKKVLSAAAMTYVAALATALAQLLRLIVMVNGRRGRR